MIRAVLVGIGLLLALAPAASAQTNVTIYGIVYNELKAPANNATVLFIAPASGQQVAFTTNASGRFMASIPSGEYRVRTWMPNTTGELWSDRIIGFIQSNNYTKPLPINRTEPFIPRAPTFSPTNNPAQIGNTTSRGNTVLLRVPLQYVGPGANKTLRIESDIRYANGTLLSQSILGNTTLRAARSSWFNVTLPANPSDPYHAREQRLLVSVRIYDEANGTLFDGIERVALTVQDECTGTTTAVTLRMATSSRTLCVPPSEEKSWLDWADRARQLQAVDATWAAQAKTNQTRWSGPEALAFWASYDQSTRPLRAALIAQLEGSQTDDVGQPRWSELQALRTQLDENRTLVRAAVQGRVDAYTASLTAEETSDRFLALGAVLGASVATAGLGVLAALMIVRQWKKRTEYWIGYSAQGQAANPLLWFATAATATLLIGLSAAWLLGGGDWFTALRGGP